MVSDINKHLWRSGHPYENFMGRWSRCVAPPFLDWLNLAPGGQWLDVGCGTGALCSAILDRCEPAGVVGIEPSEGIIDTARKSLVTTRVDLRVASASSIPFDNGRFDGVVSGLVLNFVPDPLQALGEMSRVTRTGGTVAAYVWDYAGRMEMLRYFWDAAFELQPEAASHDEGVRFPHCQPESLVSLFERAGLEMPNCHPIDIKMRFQDFADYWEPFLGGQGPAPSFAMSLAEDMRAELAKQIGLRLPTQSDGSIELLARAWAVRGCVKATIRD